MIPLFSYFGYQRHKLFSCFCTNDYLKIRISPTLKVFNIFISLIFSGFVLIILYTFGVGLDHSTLIFMFSNITIAAILAMMCFCWSGTGSYIGVFDIYHPDKEFKLHNGEVVPVDDDEPEMNNKIFNGRYAVLERLCWLIHWLIDLFIKFFFDCKWYLINIICYKVFDKWYLMINGIW